MGLRSKAAHFPAEVKLRGRQRRKNGEQGGGVGWRKRKEGRERSTRTDDLSLRTGWTPGPRGRCWGQLVTRVLITDHFVPNEVVIGRRQMSPVTELGRCNKVP